MLLFAYMPLILSEVKTFSRASHYHQYEADQIEHCPIIALLFKIWRPDAAGKISKTSSEKKPKSKLPFAKHIGTKSVKESVSCWYRFEKLHFWKKFILSLSYRPRRSKYRLTSLHKSFWRSGLKKDCPRSLQLVIIVGAASAFSRFQLRSLFHKSS